MTIKERILAFQKLSSLFMYITGKNVATLTFEISSEFEKLQEEIQDTLRQAETYNNWFTEENIFYTLNNWVDQLTEVILMEWIEEYNFAPTSKQVGIVMAGNIPLVGFHDLLAVVLSGHNALIKTSSKDEKLIDFIIKYLYSIDERFKTIIKKVERLENFDAVIATGSNNTARYFEQYFSKVPNIIRKNRTSVAVLTGNESDENLKALGNDIFRYYGLGCRNITKIFFKSKDQITHFFESILEWGGIINHPKYANNYDYNRAIYLLGKEKFLDNNFVLLKESKNLHSPIAVINYEIYHDIDEVKNDIDQHLNEIQCIVGDQMKEYESYVDFGRTQLPSLSDYADNVNTLAFLSNLSN